MNNNDIRVQNVSNLVHDITTCAKICDENYGGRFPTDEQGILQLNSEMYDVVFDSVSVKKGTKEYNGFDFSWYLVYSSNYIRDNKIIITSNCTINDELLNIVYYTNTRKLTLELHPNYADSSSNEIVRTVNCTNSWPEQGDTISIAKSFWDYYYEYKSIISNLTQKISDDLLASKNIILHGAPGTGKTYLSKVVAAGLIGTDLEHLSDSNQFAFVQFHPSYDYTDFVEGLRPTLGENNELKFTLRPGIFEKFVKNAKDNPDKKFVFVIDEINRGEINKILGELFYALDPSYRGKKGAIETQYSNLHDTNSFYKNEKQFYIPDNLYLIGTMNDIDRSIDSFDFATRRRFRFITLKANDPDILAMLDVLAPDKVDEAKQRLQSLNDQIARTDNLSEDYQIGPSYFLNLADLNYNYEILWTDYLEPLLKDYLFDNEQEQEVLKKLETAYEN